MPRRLASAESRSSDGLRSGWLHEVWKAAGQKSSSNRRPPLRSEGL